MDPRSMIDKLAALSALGKDSQAHRLLRMDFPRSDGPDAVMLVNTFKGTEEISRDFRFEVEVLSDDARIALKSMMARMVTISLVRDDGSLRYFNGYVTEFRLVRADGGFAYYNMVLEPWLAFARLRQDNVSFHGQSVIELTETTFNHYQQRDWKTILFDQYPRLTCANQHNETDYNHLHRRWEEQGLHYWYEHRADGHTLFLGDNTTLAPPIDAMRDAIDPPAMRFRAQAGAQEDDSVQHWQAVRRIGSGSMLLASFNYKNPRVQQAFGHSLNRQGNVPGYELYENAGSYAYLGPDDGDALAQRRMEEQDRLTQYFEASGNNRAAQARRSFKLEGHFSAEPKPAARGEEARASIGSRDYLIVSVVHTASNNYQAGPNLSSHYKNSFVCIRQSVRWRPGRHYNSEPCANPGVQTAIVVGPPGEEIHTDGLGRVKVQFHWDRLGKFNEHSSPWIRVMMPMTGQTFGQIGLPRVKQEVVVQFLDGNIDHPIIIGVVYNASNMPPWDLPGQRALTGMRSREIAAGRSNHLVLDDTSGGIQVQLKSDHQHSQLSLGNITRIEDTAGRKDARGEGFELASDAWGVLRAGKGMLVTTEARPNAASHIKDMGETMQRLVAAGERHKALAQMAQQQGAQESQGQQGAVADAVKTQNNDIKGAGVGNGSFPELSTPHLVLASPAGIETTSAQSTHIASAEHTALTTGRSLSIATGDSFFASIHEAFRLFVHKAGMKLIAASGKVTIQAQSDDIELIANKVLSLISQSDWVEIKGKKGVRLHGPGAMVEIGDKVQFFAPTPTLFHGNLETLGPKNPPQLAENLPVAPTSEFLHQTLQGRPSGGAQYADVAYTLYKGDTKVEDGLTDEFGRVLIPHVDGTPNYRVVLGNGEEFLLEVSPRFSESDQSLLDEQTRSNQGERALADTPESRRRH